MPSKFFCNEISNQDFPSIHLIFILSIRLPFAHILFHSLPMGYPLIVSPPTSNIFIGYPQRSTASYSTITLPALFASPIWYPIPMSPLNQWLLQGDFFYPFLCLSCHGSFILCKIMKINTWEIFLILCCAMYHSIFACQISLI